MRFLGPSDSVFFKIPSLILSEANIRILSLSCITSSTKFSVGLKFIIITLARAKMTRMTGVSIATCFQVRKSQSIFVRYRLLGLFITNCPGVSAT